MNFYGIRLMTQFTNCAIFCDLSTRMIIICGWNDTFVVTASQLMPQIEQDRTGAAGIVDDKILLIQF